MWKIVYFKPLQMHRSNFGVQGLLRGQNVSFGYQVVNNKPSKIEYYELRTMRPAGGINSSASDMANWLLAWEHWEIQRPPSAT